MGQRRKLRRAICHRHRPLAFCVPTPLMLPHAALARLDALRLQEEPATLDALWWRVYWQRVTRCMPPAAPPPLPSKSCRRWTRCRARRSDCAGSPQTLRMRGALMRPLQDASEAAALALRSRSSQHAFPPVGLSPLGAAHHSIARCNAANLKLPSAATGFARSCSLVLPNRPQVRHPHSLPRHPGSAKGPGVQKAHRTRGARHPERADQRGPGGHRGKG